MAKKQVQKSKSPTKIQVEAKPTITKEEITVKDQNWGFIPLAMVGVAYAIYVYWGMASNGTWDDDCVGRYFNTADAFRNPAQFVDMWNRPLFVTLFAVPVQMIGKAAIPIVMSAISCLGAYWLYKSAKILGLASLPLVLIFFLFQPYYFGVGRDAMTEPLAAAVMCGGLYFSLTQRWFLFAVIGSLLPLARIEMSLVLPIWAWMLYKNDHLKYILLLGLGVVLWNLAGWVIEGDPLFVINKALFSNNEENRYGHQPFNTYFSRYLYVIGPAVFYFLILGLVNRVQKQKFDWFVLAQFIFGFMVYTIFAWKLNVGQSAGFLRNLLPISPLVAILATEGFDSWSDAILTKKKTTMAIISSLVIVTIVWLFFNNKIDMHHIVSDKRDMYNLPIVAGLTVVGMLVWMLFRKPSMASGIKLGLLAMVSLATVGHTLLTEPPNANMNDERSMIENVQEAIENSGLINAPKIHVAHAWFQWAGGYDRNDPKFGQMTKESIEKAIPGTVYVWESHYSNRLGNSIELDDLNNHPEMVLLGQFLDQSLSRPAYVFVKKEPNESKSACFDRIVKTKEIPEFELTKFKNAIASNNKTLADQIAGELLTKFVDHPAVNWEIINYYRSNGRIDEALTLTEKLLKKNEKGINLLYTRGSIRYEKGMFGDALKDFNEVAQLNPNFGQAYYNIGLCYVSMKNNSKGCSFFNQALGKNFAGAQQAIDTYCK